MLGQRSNQLNYVPTRQINEMRNRQCLRGFARFAYRAWNYLCCTKERDSCPNRPQTAPKFEPFPALLRCAKRPAQNAPRDPDCCQSRNRQQKLRTRLAQKYPNSFSLNTKGQASIEAHLHPGRFQQIRHYTLYDLLNSVGHQELPSDGRARSIPTTSQRSPAAEWDPSPHIS